MPNYDTPGIERNFFNDVTIYGYQRAVQSGGEITGIRGDGVPPLDIGAKVTLKIKPPYGFRRGEQATIYGFSEPFVSGNTDLIVKVQSDSGEVAVLKPSEVEL